MNILITTDVAEEGIDMPNCSFVIRFDLPKTVRSYVQSRGRARQADSNFLVMLERYKFLSDLFSHSREYRHGFFILKIWTERMQHKEIYYQIL